MFIKLLLFLLIERQQKDYFHFDLIDVKFKLNSKLIIVY
jgi:hypothetical protein